MTSCEQHNSSPLPVRSGQWAILLAISALYIGFGMTMGLIQGGFPTIMRDRGMSLESVGWLYALYLPLGVAFLWSPLVDRWRPPFLAPELAWIVPMQLASALVVVAAAFMEGASLHLLFILGLFVAFAMATMDIALDALAVERIEAAWRPRAAACKLAALSIGAMIGGGAFVALFNALGWTLIFLCYAASLLMLIVPMLLLTRGTSSLSRAPIASGQGASLRKLIRHPAQRKRLILLTLCCCVIFPLSALNRLMLLDLNVPMSLIGGIVGTLGPVTMLLTAGVSAPLMQRFGLPEAIWLFTILGVSALAAMIVGYTWVLPWLAISGAVAIGAAVSGIYVVLSARILGWSRTEQPATDYATFYGVGRFVSTLTTIAFAQMVAWLSWPLFYLGGAVALLIVVGLLHNSVDEKDKEYEPA
ncbi:MFS transporter [Klebsiella sp. BIGb0407]|uniref:MFS transporter n=1 Tax=Klebsiella sp. BIGb0407 TaxID=2940603 RepID=UPI00216A6178|nr:MFS transporter [Klebsiella sp. BIGb0407]MCS3431624.1 MFS family permease [Klebsiella sp. BIGb0407]